ncbi:MULTISPECIES: uracil-DNA glycosylase family protein [unclassified Halomonas]|uniref:uracil-DNA glycosylase family protein n=1 Tax=unclassified Halomonas TaxID=2609666 RepID=UPI0020A12582|nr:MULTISPECIES: uracil-DNA glycosylase family protein [unclassified Halomonas]MCP1312795.1 uracil-DNA glycosylase family protein [Halomonas sp. 707D7]MCP1325286.1 uracil-DNA glycosylase family protein [Halomonas sp. 707D4]
MPLTTRQRERFRALAAETDGIDLEVYQRFERDPLEPIIGLGRRDVRLGFFGRDPGRDEVRFNEPFIGAGGQLVRKALYRHLFGKEMPDFDAAEAIGEHFFWINTVPFKPVGNKAWSMKVKRRFHGLVSEVLISHWEGRTLITLGREAFLWFGIGRSKEERDRLEAFWKREDRFERHIDVTLEDEHGKAQTFTLYPLPHPSPLNQTWYRRFPDLLKQRLEQLDVQRDNLTL